MSFNEKIHQCKENLSSIDNPKYIVNDPNSRADYLELSAVFAGDDGVSRGDVFDALFGEIREPQTIDTDVDIPLDEAVVQDKNEGMVDQMFSMLKERQNLYEELYPFVLTDNNEIKLKENLSHSQQLYLLLLFSSSLNIFGAFQTELTTDFEQISYETMKAYLPNAMVKHFGKKTEYEGTAKEKIMRLALDIGLSVDEDEIACIGERNVQERGLDIVAWIPFSDTCYNIIVFLGQCACGKNYESKQHDVRRYENYYRFYRTKPQHTLFIPYSLINPSKRKFYHSDCIENDYLVFERKRILTLLSNKVDLLMQLDSKTIIENICRE